MAVKVGRKDEREKGKSKKGIGGERGQGIKEEGAVYGIHSEGFDWEGNLQWIYDYETGFDAHWTV